MNFFEEATLRLKQQLHVTQDKQVAAVLSMTEAAWKMRKKRDNFPVKEVFALAAQKPELGLDPDWIVTGIANKTEIDDRDIAYLVQCYQVMTPSNRSAMLKIACALSDIQNLSGGEITRRMENYKQGLNLPE